MVRLDGMLMIGSAGRKVGKTNLACALVGRFGRSNDLIGIKVTTIREKDGQCPRGGEGCGVCSSLDGDFLITEEVNRSSEKDTSRLLAAGAKRVFWLRVMKTHLKEGLTTLLDVIGPDAISICESNSLRHAVKPGLFLIVNSEGKNKWKSSAQEVKAYADRLVTSDGQSFDFDIGRIDITNGKWTLQEQATAIIMAGGESLRMGVDKGMLPVNRRDGSIGPITEIIAEQLRGTFPEILISANEAEKFAFLDLPVIRDRSPGQGPLMGIASVLGASVNELNFVVACDIPHIELTFVRRMLKEAEEADIVIPTTGEDRYEPLFAVYRKGVVESMNEVLCAGRRKISDVFDRCRVKYMELGDAEWFVNLNSMAEYEEYQKRQHNQV